MENRYQAADAMMRDLLRSVSRSFYLSLRLLPVSVRPTLALAYLLARASDSITDAASASVTLRSRLLEGFPDGWARDEARHLGLLPAGEKELLESLPELLQQLESSPDREEILEVWKIILGGQIFDLQRFGPGVSALTLDEAARYTGLVAGCVGEFWTKICFKHVPGYSREPLEAMCVLGFEFGCGLQWVNILRDRHADAAAGRVYVAEENYPEAMRAARAGLDAGTRYASFVRPRRLRAACRLPLEIGIRTLDLVDANPAAPRLKVGRGFVWLSLARALWH
jgi:farnesyl-diphosphate farnesyltransferase